MDLLTIQCTLWKVVLTALVLTKCESFQFDNADDEIEVAVPPVSHMMDLDMKEKVRQGEKSYEMLKSDAPLYGVCWLNALDALHMGCKQLDEETHSRLGLLFANCFLEKMSGRTFPCPPEQQIATCIADMDDRGFQAYMQFFVHTQSICFFLANQLWQSQAEQTIGKMTSASHQVAERLQRLQSLQQKSIDTQLLLNQELGASKTALQDFERTLRDKHSMEKEILIRFLEMRDFILNEVSKFYAIGFYCGAALFFYLLTSPVRTKEARIWSFLILAFNLALERLIVSNILSDKSQVKELFILSAGIDDHVWICRKVCLIVTLILLLYYACTYKDYNVLNNVLLNDIRRQNEEIKRLHEISLTKKSEVSDLATVIKSYMSSDESSAGSDDEISESEVDFIHEEREAIGYSEIPAIECQQTLNVEPQLKAIVAVESGSQRYNLRARSPTTFGAHRRPLSGKRMGSNQKLAKTESFSKSIFSSDEDC